MHGEKGKTMRLIDADNFISVCEILADKCDDKRAFEQAILIAKDVPTIDTVPRKAFDGILWENDVMRKQLADIRKSFGEKMDDVVKVVRCKDCEFYRFYDGVFGKGWICFENNTARHEDDYCSRGERKEDE